MSNNGHILPPEETIPDEAPPTYEESCNHQEASSSTLPVIPDSPPPPRLPPRPQLNNLQAPPLPSRPSSSNSHHSAQSSPRPRPHRRPVGIALGNPLLHYPNGYHCSKCNNTGVQMTGNTCQDCWQMFSSPNQANIPGPQQLHTGRVECGLCRGRGMVHDWGLGDDNCPVCRGVGRVG